MLFQSGAGCFVRHGTDFIYTKCELDRCIGKSKIRSNLFIVMYCYRVTQLEFSTEKPVKHLLSFTQNRYVYSIKLTYFNP